MIIILIPPQPQSFDEDLHTLTFKARRPLPRILELEISRHSYVRPRLFRHCCGVARWRHRPGSLSCHGSDDTTMKSAISSNKQRCNPVAVQSQQQMLSVSARKHTRRSCGVRTTLPSPSRSANVSKFSSLDMNLADICSKQYKGRI